MNNALYFEHVYDDETVYGRYYRMNNIMYVTTAALNDSSILEHEVAHYMCDDCMLSANFEAEEQMVQRFIKRPRE